MERFNHTRSIEVEDIVSQIIWKRRPTSKENLLRFQSNKRILSEISWAAKTEISLTAYCDKCTYTQSHPVQQRIRDVKTNKEKSFDTQSKSSPAKFGQFLGKSTMKTQQLR